MNAIFEKLSETVEYLFDFGGAARSVCFVAIAFEECYLVYRVVEMHEHDVLPVNRIQRRWLPIRLLLVLWLDILDSKVFA